MTTPKVLMIGLDSGDPAVTRRLMAEGRMPSLSALGERGAVFETVPPLGLFGGTVWPSFFTAVDPSRHGRYCFRQLVVGTYEDHDVGAGNVEWTPFWHHLSDDGHRVGIFDVPHTNIRGELNGLQVSGWGAHDSGPGFVTFPPSLHDDIARRFGEHPFGSDCNEDREDPDAFLRFRDGLMEGIGQRIDMASHYIDSEDLDFFLYVFSETHCVGHQCWRIHDPDDPGHVPAIRDALGADPVDEIYETLDAAVGQLLTKAGPETTVLVWFSHGMAPRRTGNHLLEDVLVELDRAGVDGGARKVAGGLRAAWTRVPTPLKRVGMKLLKRSPVNTAQIGLGPTWGDFATRRFFQIPNNDTWGGVRINLVGREPAGIVTEQDYDAVCDEVTEGLLGLINEDTGRPAVTRVVKARDVYSGERLDRLPDLMVDWNRDHLITTVSSPKVARIRKLDEHCRSGDHREEGLLFAAGPHVQAGEHDPVKVERIAPTVATLLGSVLPDVTDPPIDEIAGRLASRPTAARDS